MNLRRKKNALHDRRMKWLLAATGAALSPCLRADSLTFIAPGGNWSTATNWSEQYVPETGDVTDLLNTGTNNTIITFDNASPIVNLSSNTIDYTGSAGGSVTFSQSVNAFSTTVEYIGLSGTGLMNLTGGTHTISGAGSNALYVGYNVGSSGTVNMSGATTSLVATDSVYVGYSGTGVFNQSAGSHSLGGYLVLGGEPTGTAVAGTGTYNLSGGVVTVNTLYSGLTGSGNFVQTGGTVTAGGLTSGYLPGSSGTVSLGGSGFMDVTGGMTIGDQGNGTFTESNGFELNSGLIVGNSAGGFGTVVLTGGQIWCEGVSVLGSRGSATILQSGGTFNQYENLFLAVAGGGAASYSLSNGGTLHVVSSVANGTTFFGGEYIGYQGPAVFNQSGGSHIIDVYFYLGAQPGGSGTYNLSGGALICPAQNIGGGGTANDVFNQTGGSNIAGSYVALGWLGGTRGTYNLSAGNLNIGGGLYDGYKGTGSFTQSGGAINTGQFYLGYAPFSSGFYTLSGGSLNVSTSEDIGYQSSGIFTQTGGTHTVAGTATIHLSSLSGGVGTYNLQGGTLSAGPMINNGAFNLTGGTATLTNLSGTGTTSISGTSSAKTILSLNQMIQQSVTIGSGGKISLAQLSSPATNMATSLSITGSGRLDIANQSVLTNTSESTIKNYLINGYANAFWNGTSATGGSITSITAFNDNSGATSVGYGNSSDFTFPGSTSPYAVGGSKALAAGQMVVKPALTGDLLLNGSVGPADLAVLLNSFGTTGNSWAFGNLDYDKAGLVGPNDLVLLLSNFGRSSSGLSQASPAVTAAKSLATAAKPALLAGSSDVTPPPPADGIELIVNFQTGDVEIEGNNATAGTSIVLTSNANGLVGGTTFTPAFSALFNTSASNTNGLIDQFNTFTNGSGVNSLVDMGNIYNTIQNSGDVQFQFSEKGINRGGLQTGSVTYVGVPEPTTLSLLAATSAGSLARRRRKPQRQD